ncbi:MAG: PorV/PorQ family protein [Candidatus Marinimicrobia bacterium]|nr:PorV/PorQ family protein [Candidatus Neomarinimicrobiota bacterium]
MKKIIRLTLLVLLLNITFAQSVSKVGTSSAKFLSVPVDARGTSMGQAVVTGFNDPSTLFWNPSTIAYLSERSIHFSYTKWFEDINFKYFVGVFPAGSIGTFGVNVTYFQTDPMEVTTEMAQEGTGEYFTVGSYAIGVAFARQLTVDFAIGSNIKYIMENIYHMSATGVAMDIGVRYLTPWRGIRLGFSIRNFGTKMHMIGEDLLTTVDPDPMNSGNNDVINAYYATDKFDLPLNMTIGLAWDVINSNNSRLTFEVDGLYPSDNYERVNAGLEMSILKEMIYLRTGVANLFLDSIDPYFSVGAGIRYSILGNMNLCVDYAYQTHEYFSKNEHISVTITF